MIPPTHPDAERLGCLLDSLTAGSLMPAALTAARLTPRALAVLYTSIPGLETEVRQAAEAGERVRAGRASAGARKEESDGEGMLRGRTSANLGRGREDDGTVEEPRPDVERVGGDGEAGAAGSEGATLTKPSPEGRGDPPGLVDASGDIPLRAVAGGGSAPREPDATTVETIPQLATRLAREREAEEIARAALAEVRTVTLDMDDAPAPTVPRSKRASEATDGGGGADSERWDRVREEAARLAPGILGFVLWVDRRRVDSQTGLYPMDPAWVRHLDGFYASGEFEDIGRFGVRAAKSDTICTAITGETLLIQRTLAGSIVGVCPVMSANMREAGDRFDTVKANLRACGFRDLSGTKEAVDAFTFKASGGGNSALVVETFDSQGHEVEFRVYPASESGAAGFTGIAGFGDELDLWGKAQGANPASKVLRVLRSRYTTQPEAKLHLMSATYDRESEHARLIKNGNCPGQYVARLGKEGAAKDHADRLRLAALIQSADPLLLAPPLPPECPDIPSWVTNPVAPIEEAFKKSKGDLREMFALYGGRLDMTGGAGAVTAEDIRWMVEQNRAINAGVTRSNAERADAYMRGDDESAGTYRGL